MPYRADIDGLRAVSVIAVICFHAHVSLFDTELASGGYLGVDVFFVISGYLIAGFILRGLATDDFSLADFYNRRARRILPALFLVLAVSFAVAVLLLTPRQLVDFSESLAACIFFVSNIFFWLRSDYFAEPSELTPLLHTWSLSVEEQFYVIFPLILTLLWKHARRILVPCLALAAVVSLLAAVRANAMNPPAAFYLFQYKAWELLVGAALAGLEQQHKWQLPYRLRAIGPALGLTMLVAAFFFLGSRGAIGAGSIAVVAGTVLVISGSGGPAHRILSSKPFVAIGLISYSLYLWHQPLFAFARLYALTAPGAVAFLLLILASGTMAALSWRYVEQPFRGPTFSRRQFGAAATSVGLSLLTVTLLAATMAGFPGRYTQDQQALFELTPERGAISIDGRPCARRKIADACIIGDAGVAPSFAVLGDSHAETLTRPLDQLFKARSLSAYVFTNAGCPFIANVVERAAASHCDRHVADALEALRRHNVSRVIINDRSTGYIMGTRFDNKEGGVEPGAPFPVEPVRFSGNDSERIEAVSDAWRHTMRQLIEHGVTIYYVLPVPEVGWHVPRTLVKLIARGGPALTTSLSTYLERNKLVLTLAKEFSTASQFVPIYPDKIFCGTTSGRCGTYEGSDIFYTDTDHLSQQGAEKLVAAIAREIDARR